MSEGSGLSVRSYGCTFGCGNPYDVIIISVADGTTEMLCMPCYVRMASDVIEAITQPDSDAVKAAIAAAGSVDQAPMRGQGARSRGHNAPATADDPDIFEAYDSRVTAEELPEEFK